MTHPSIPPPHSKAWILPTSHFRQSGPLLQGCVQGDLGSASHASQLLDHHRSIPKKVIHPPIFWLPSLTQATGCPGEEAPLFPLALASKFFLSLMSQGRLLLFPLSG